MNSIWEISWKGRENNLNITLTWIWNLTWKWLLIKQIWLVAFYNRQQIEIVRWVVGQTMKMKKESYAQLQFTSKKLSLARVLIVICGHSFARIVLISQARIRSYWYVKCAEWQKECKTLTKSVKMMWLTRRIILNS